MLEISAKDNKAGMSFEEIQDALSLAQAQRYTGGVKASLGFRGQIQKLKFSLPNPQ